MASEKLRRLMPLVLSMALALGLITQGLRTSAMAAMMPMVAIGDMLPSDDCDGCITDGTAMTPAACMVQCNDAPALAALVTASDSAAILRQPAGSAGLVLVGLRNPPDPHPPR